MPPTHDLKRALLAVAEADRSPADPAADLARARTAARTRSRRRFRVALSGVAATAVIGLTVGMVLDRAPDEGAPTSTAPGTATATAEVRLVAQTLDATPYTFDLTPAGWVVQGQTPTGVTIVPDDGSTSDSLHDFRGKLVIMFDANPPDGRVLDVDGRRFWVSGDSGYVTMATRTVAGEPGGMVRIQYPRDAGWDEDSMVAFLGSVHVGPGAQQGVG